ncbi:hypothetical protein F0562_001002 [Nyssa sinensis]|uniref:C2H2-type domain-containing protein n=1 Tax=Nyssa sinensis TaxID=561372 RepID=A0A5J5C216_9ASTE|nr:hypothetical protein F0562_001002 [Nyssa sinensis]
METDSPAPANSDQAVICNSDEQGPSQGSTARSYECTFCKRGFCNAQALGGHMNLHRKDKAKLKQQALNEAHQFLDIPKTTPLYSSIPTTTIPPLEFQSTEDKAATKWPWVLPSEDDTTPRDETHVKERRKLPLFAETTSENQNLGVDVGTNIEKGFSSSHGRLGPELDLELRLGHEPQDSSATAADSSWGVLMLHV